MLHSIIFQLKPAFQRFLRDEDAAITVDWVVLTAGIMLMGVVAVQQIKPAQDAIGEDIKTSLEAGAQTLDSPDFQ